MEYLGTNKPVKNLRVDTLYELVVGRAATFTIGPNVIKTSYVTEVFIVNSNKSREGYGFALFETKNTRYRIEYRDYFVN